MKRRNENRQSDTPTAVVGAKVPVCVRLEPDLNRQVREAMAREKRGFSDQVNLLLARGLEASAAA